MGDFFGELRGTDLAEGGGIDQVQVAVDQRGEGFFGILPRVRFQQFQVTCHRFQVYRHRAGKSDKEVFGMPQVLRKGPPGQSRPKATPEGRQNEE